MSGGFARLYQKTSLVPYRWVIRASSTGLPGPLSLGEIGQVDWVPEAFTRPVTLDRPRRLDFEARWLLRPLSPPTPFLDRFFVWE